MQENIQYLPYFYKQRLSNAERTFLRSLKKIIKTRYSKLPAYGTIHCKQDWIGSTKTITAFKGETPIAVIKSFQPAIPKICSN